MLELTGEQLEKLKKIELDILKTTIEICKKIDVRYFVVGGTLLGTIRHQGFIPWDDDIDIGMLRKDYDRFIEKAKDYLPENLFLQNIYTEENWINNYSKIRNKDTVYVETSVKDMDIEHGVFIDIFPIDNYPDTTLRERIIKTKLRMIDRRLASEFFETNPGSMSAKARFILAISKKIWPKAKKASLLKEKIITSVPESSLLKTYCGAWGDREIAEKKWLEDVEERQFEDIMVNIPKEYDKYLTHVYGDYMTLPPVEKRKGHHWVEKIELGD